MAESFQPIADHVWFYPYHPESDPDQPGVGAVVTSSETVLIDAGNGPRHARQIRAALRAIDAPPVQYVIYTHHHWDHTFGAQIWYDSRIIAHEQCQALLTERYGGQPWNRQYIQGLSALEPAREPALRAMSRAIDDWNAFRLVMPHLTFTHKLDLFLPEATVTLRHVGGQHAPDSIIVLVDHVLFSGDCTYPPPPHMRQSEDQGLDLEVMAHLLDYDATIYVDAHGRPRTREEISRFLET